MWRARDAAHVLLMAGRTTQYAIEPRGEYIFGIVAAAPMMSRRGSERRLIQPGQLVAWDPSGAHSGVAVDGRPWFSRLMAVEAADLAALAGDHEVPLPADIAFPEPAVSDPELARNFVRMHRSFESPYAMRLEQDQRLAEWIGVLVDRASSGRPLHPPLRPRDDRALRLASEYLADQPERNIGLD
jgi:hypothetical protein